MTKFSTSFHPMSAAEVREYAEERGCELAAAYTLMQLHTHLRRQGLLRAAQIEVECAEGLSDYASDAASNGIERLIEIERERAKKANEAHADSLLLEMGLVNTVRLGTWSTKTDDLMFANNGEDWTRARLWATEGSDPETLIYVRVS